MGIRSQQRGEDQRDHGKVPHELQGISCYASLGMHTQHTAAGRKLVLFLETNEIPQMRVAENSGTETLAHADDTAMDSTHSDFPPTYMSKCGFSPLRMSAPLIDRLFVVMIISLYCVLPDSRSGAERQLASSCCYEQDCTDVGYASHSCV